VAAHRYDAFARASVVEFSGFEIRLSNNLKKLKISFTIKYY